MQRLPPTVRPHVVDRVLPHGGVQHRVRDLGTLADERQAQLRVVKLLVGRLVP